MTNTPEKQPDAKTKPPKEQSSKVKELSEKEMRKRYLEQQARRACPGCGEPPFLG